MFGSFGNTNQSSGGGLFGGGTTNQQQPQQQQQQQPGSLFGTSTQPPQQQQQPPQFGSQPQTGGGGLFGGAQTSGTGGGLFGGAQPSGTGGTGGGLFGSTAKQSQNQNQGSGGGLFGSSTTQQPQQQGGGLFGSSTTQQPQQQGGLFGNSTTQPPQQQGGLFGNSTTQPPQQQGGLFGSSTTQPSQQQGGLFGSTTTQNQTQQPSTGGGLFGGTATQPSTTGQSGGLFGSAPSNTSNPLLGGGGGGLFGGNKPAGSLFGQPTNNVTGTQPSFFGNLGQSQNTQQQQPQQQQQQPSGSLFGQPAQQQQRPAGSLFGGLGQSNTNPSGGLFGNSLVPSTSTSNTLFSSTSRGGMGPAQQQADAQSQFAALTQRIESIAQAWNSNSPQCRFQHYFYNLVDPNQVSLYGRPPNATNEALWQQAVRENPDRSCLVPVVAIGFDDLNQRVDAQSQQAAAHQEKLKELKTRIEALSQRHEVSNASRLHRASSLQTQLTHRLLKLIQHLHLLIPALRSSAIRPEEEALRTALEEIDEHIRAGRMRGKLNELWALVGAVNAAKERRSDGGTEWAVVDEEGLAQIAQILTEQQAGLAHLTKILHGNLKDLKVVQGGGVQEDTDNLFSSTSTLRASMLR